jgi:FAD/FMN-containing dehydrogenase
MNEVMIAARCRAVARSRRLLRCVLGGQEKVQREMSIALDTFPKRRLAGFGRTHWSECHLAQVENVDGLRQLFARCRDERVQLAFRGSGRSYGDAALLSKGLVVDLRARDEINRLTFTSKRILIS